MYDALTTKRVYKEAISHAKAVEIVAQQSGTHFDPVIVQAFLQCANEFEHLARELSDAASSAAAEGAPESQEAVSKPSSIG